MVQVPMYGKLNVFQGFFFVDEDLDTDLCLRKWRRHQGYPVERGLPRSQGQSVSRIIMERMIGRPLLPTEHVHHKNEDPTINTRANLELMTVGEHTAHHGRRGRSDNGLPIGVCWDKQRAGYLARITQNGKRRHLGLFDTPEEASTAYQRALVEEMENES